LWRQPQFRRLLLLNGAAAAAIDAHGFILPLLGHERALSASAIGFVISCFAAATAVMRLSMPFFVNDIREWKLTAVAMAVATLVLIAYPFAGTPIAMALCATALGGSISCVQPMVMSMIHQVAPANRQGEAVAMRHLLVNSSTSAMAVLFAAVSGFAAVGGLFWVMAVVTGFGTQMSRGLRDLEEDHGHGLHK
jgi:predicted MFS family arabinose efflux permease